MDVLMTQEQEMVRDAARDVLSKECPPALVRRMEEDPLGYDPALWAQAAALGWPGLALPEAHGGSGLPLVYMGIVLQEVGRALAPIPLHSTVTAALTLAEAADPALAAEILPRVAAGEAILTWAADEAAHEAGPPGDGLRARVEGGQLVIDGRAGFVDNVRAADHILVVARTEPASAARSGVTLALVPTASPGLAEAPLVTTAKDRQSEVTFTDVRVPLRNLIGPLHGGGAIAARLVDRATILLCAQLLGAARKDAEFAFDYARMREAFGQPIGAFQSIQHACADMIIWIDGGDLLTFEALWRLDEGLPAEVEISQAKAFCNDKTLASARNAQIIHGGIGFMMELDLHLWYRRIAAWTMRLGTTYSHRARIARALLDHPGQVILGRELPGAGARQDAATLRMAM